MKQLLPNNQPQAPVRVSSSPAAAAADVDIGDMRCLFLVAREVVSLSVSL